MEAFSWRVLTEVARLRPGEFRLVERHPCSGQYDCLALFVPGPRCLLEWNRGGSVHLMDNPESKSSGVPNKQVLRYLAEGDSHGMVRKLAKSLRTSVPPKLPASTPDVVVYRFVSALLEQSVFRPEPWECRSGYHDTFGYDGGVRESDFALFPGAREEMGRGGSLWDGLEAAHDYWFLKVGKESKLCLRLDGTLWDRQGRRFDLYAMYKERGGIWPVMLGAAGDLLE